MHVTKEGIDRLKAANPLEVILADRGIELKKKGRVLVARCPFHEEKTASFTVTPSKGLYHCFGCGARGDVVGFITKRDKVGFPRAMEILARRAGLDLKELMAERPIVANGTPQGPADALAQSQAGAPLNGHGHEVPQIETATVDSSTSRRLLASVVEHYHRTFCERPDAQEYLTARGLVGPELLKAWKVGYADGSLLKTLPKSGEVRDGLVALGVITAESRELMGGCVVFPIPDPLSASWINLYGRGVKSGRHCYLPGPLRGVFNFQAARAGEEVILTESVIDACSFHQAGVRNSIPLYGINGFTGDHLDLLKREGVKRAVLALDNDEAGRRTTESIKERLMAAGVEVRAVEWPEGVKDANEVLVSWSADLLREIASCPKGRLARSAGRAPGLLAMTVVNDHQIEAFGAGQGEDAATIDSFPLTDSVKASSTAPVAFSSSASIPTSKDGSILLSRHGLDFSARVQSTLLGRLRVTVKVSRGDLFHVDSIDLYASRARSEFAKKVEKVLSAEAAQVESALLSLIVECERVGEADGDVVVAQPEPMTESDRREALAFLKRPDLLDEVGRDMDALGYVGETSTKILGYLISVSRKGDDPCSAIVISQSGAGKSALTEVIEKLTPPEDVVLFTRLTPQSLYYTEPGFLDHKLIMIEERNGSMEADYSIRVLQSRKKLIAAVPIKDPATGNLRTKIFTVEARAAFIEATTAGAVNHENATRCFELSMDESPAQTQRIHGRQRVMRTEAGLGLRKEAEAIASKHWNAQRLLESLPVIIPFAEQLTFPSSWMRTRRDHARFLNLIEVSAFLHQYQRERRSGAIVASVADYAVAYSLAGEVLKDTLQDLKKPLRETFERIRVLASKSDGALTRSAIREALALPDSTVRRWLAELVELEYLETETVKQGKAARYALTGRVPQENLSLGLLSPEDLAGKLSNFATSPNFAKAVWRT